MTTDAETASFVEVLLQRSPAEDISANVHTEGEADALRKTLREIGRRHGLSVSDTDSPTTLRVEFSKGGIATHVIRLQFPASETAIVPTATASAGARLAIIVDDMGNDQQSADALLALPVPLTISVLPDLPFSKEVANETAERGDEVMLHLPMEPVSKNAPSQPVELREGMSDEQIQATLARMLESVPHVSGVNNHEGSKATADPALMSALMPALRERGLFFIDSRTIGSTVAFETAQHFGVRAASRKVFLDDDVTRGAITQQVALAVTDALRDGSAIAIGHPHPETIAVLREELPRLRQRNVQLVFASDLAR